jgi:hypothetical protein
MNRFKQFSKKKQVTPTEHPFAPQVNIKSAQQVASRKEAVRSQYVAKREATRKAKLDTINKVKSPRVRADDSGDKPPEQLEFESMELQSYDPLASGSFTKPVVYPRHHTSSSTFRPSVSTLSYDKKSKNSKNKKIKSSQPGKQSEQFGPLVKLLAELLETTPTAKSRLDKTRKAAEILRRSRERRIHVKDNVSTTTSVSSQLNQPLNSSHPPLIAIPRPQTANAAVRSTISTNGPIMIPTDHSHTLVKSASTPLVNHSSIEQLSNQNSNNADKVKGLPQNGDVDRGIAEHTLPHHDMCQQLNAAPSRYSTSHIHISPSPGEKASNLEKLYRVEHWNAPIDYEEEQMSDYQHDKGVFNHGNDTKGIHVLYTCHDEVLVKNSSLSRAQSHRPRSANSFMTTTTRRGGVHPIVKERIRIRRGMLTSCDEISIGRNEDYEIKVAQAMPLLCPREVRKSSESIRDKSAKRGVVELGETLATLPLDLQSICL